MKGWVNHVNGTITFNELVEKVKQQEDTVAQLVRIVAATNHRIAQLQHKHEHLEKSIN